jgi:hypothetical protein
MTATETNLEAAEAAVASITMAKRVWVLPILRVLESMGGSGKPKDVKAAVRDLFEGQLTETQLTQLEKRARLGWTRLEMVQLGGKPETPVSGQTPISDSLGAQPLWDSTEVPSVVK